MGLDKTIFHALLESDLPPQEKLHSRLWQEGQVVIGAGADTVSITLTIIHFHLLDNVDVLEKLRKELEDAMPDRFEPAKLGVVEKLPYLVRCVIIMKNTVDFYCCRMLLLTKV
jgi:cytochrome P450